MTKAAPLFLLLLLLPAFVLLGACQGPERPPEAPMTPAATASSASSAPRHEERRGGRHAIAASPAGESECKIACARFGECTPDVPNAKTACESDCMTSLFAHDPDAPKRYGSCLDKLTCPAIKMSLMMNEGPAARCYPRVHSRETANH